MKTSQKILSIVFVIMPILAPYGFGGVLDFGVILFIFVTLLIIIFGKCKIKMCFPKHYLLFFFYMLTIPVIFSIGKSYSSIGNGIIKATIYTIALGIGCYYFDPKYGISFYKKTVIALCLFFLFQEITFFMSGYRVAGLIPSFPLIYEDINMADFIADLRTSKRSSSLFLEPAHFAQYILPYLAMELFRKDKKYVISPGALFVTTVLLLLFSGNGLLIGMILWIGWFFSAGEKAKSGIVLKCFIVVIAFLLIPVYLQIEGGEVSISKRAETALSQDIEADSYGSEYLRIYRGYLVYNEMSTVEKFIGISQGSLPKFIASNNHLKWIFRDDSYINAIQSVLVYGGIVGFILFFLYLFDLYRDNNLIGKMIVLSFFLLCFIAAVYYSSVMLQYILFAYAFRQIQNKDSRK